MTAIPSSDELLSRMKKLHPLMIDLSLDRIERLLVKLGSPQDALPPVIHIAGTNGKGSTLAFLKAMFEAGGKSVAAYTSPHLVRFHERITVPLDDRSGPSARGGGRGHSGPIDSDCDSFRDAREIGGKTDTACERARSAPISEPDLAHYLHAVLELNDGEPITYFEITTAAGLLAIAESQADIALLEVGLGGRFDTTNVVAKPALCVITPVSMDHADKLGSTVAKIAREKAGILKPGVCAVIAQQTSEAMQVIEEVAANVGAPLLAWGRDFDAFEQNGRLVFKCEGRLMDLPLPALHGRHQVRNAGLAVACVLALQGEIHKADAADGATGEATDGQTPARNGRLPAIRRAGLHTGTAPVTQRSAQTAAARTTNTTTNTTTTTPPPVTPACVTVASTIIGLADHAIERGLTCVEWPARLQRLTRGPITQNMDAESELWLDGGHNEAAGQALAQAAADLEDRASKPLILIVGMMGAKDARGFLAPFAGLARRVIAVPIAKMENDLGDTSKEAADLAELAREMGFAAGHAPDPLTAVGVAREMVEGPVRILICGSLYLAGQVLALNS